MQSPRISTLARGATILAVAAGLTAGLALPAAAAPPATKPNVANSDAAAHALDELKATGAAAIAQRQAQLTKLSGRLSAAPACDAGGKIAGVIAADGPALTQLGAELAVDTTLADAKADFQSIFDDYRIYLVVTPQTYAAAACGRIQRATATLTEDQAKLTTRVDAAAAGGADLAAAKAALADMAAKIADARSLGDQAAAALAALAPDHRDKAVMASNAAAVEAARLQLETARTDLAAATADAHTVIDALKALG